MKVTNSSQSDSSQGVWENIIEDSLVENLPASANSQPEQPTENFQKQSSQGSTQVTKRSEIDLAAHARATQLNQLFAQNVQSAAPQPTNQSTSSNNRIYKDGVTNLVAIASSSKYTAAEKEEYFHDYMSASKDNLRNLVTGSELWPAQLRQYIDNALISSPKLQERVAKELTPTQQIEVLDRLVGSALDAGPAIAKIIEKTDKSSLDYIASHMKDIKNLDVYPTLKDSNWSDVILNTMAQRAKDLSPDSRLALSKKIMEFEYIDSAIATKHFRYQNLQRLFENMTPIQKNLLFDQLQDHGELSRFAEAITNNGAVPISILSGLSDKNADFLRVVYLKLASDANDAGKKDLGNQYENNVLQLKGWLENHYPKYIIK